MCGLQYISDKCDAGVSIDADLQDDLAAIPQMVMEFQNGSEIVLGVRKSRDADTWFKRTSAQGFYKFMRLIGVDLVENHADFRLMSSTALQNLGEFKESNLFLRGLPMLLSNKIAYVTYTRAERFAGVSKYPLRKMLALAWTGITSFSVLPLRIISILAGLVFLTSIGMISYAIVGVVAGKAIPGWASVVIPLYLLGGFLMLSIGVVGEYVGKVFLEVKRRPKFFVDKIIEERLDK
jgi:hypothetical protein